MYRITRVTSEIEKNPGRKFTISDMADIAGMSQFHFARRFKKSIGVTPKKYLEGVRVREARFMLERDAIKIAAVALILGFAHQAHMTQAFHRHLGHTPGYYAKSRPTRE